MLTQNHYLNHVLAGLRQQELLDEAARERETRSFLDWLKGKRGEDETEAYREHTPVYETSQN